MKKKPQVIRTVAPGGIGEELGIAPGDVLESINGVLVEDVFDYHYLLNEEYVEVLIRKPDGEEWLLEVEKEEEEELGIEFENPLMDEYRSCSNGCIFCFIDQMPPGMRPTLYFKDDDSRLSFLQGNYVTLTNVSGEDLDRIIRYHLSPINISFHTTDPKLRCRMLNNRFAGDILEKTKRLRQAGVEMNGQIVLCKGINDGEALDRTIGDLYGFLPELKSLSVVPVGLTRYREGLFPLEPFGREEAGKVLACVRKWQKRAMEEYGRHFVHASDEWYLLAGEALPSPGEYDGYPQLENGVGMLPLLMEELAEAYERHPLKAFPEQRRISAATGLLAAPFLRQIGRDLERRYPGLALKVYPVENRFFGERITVSGLLTGRDLAEQLSGEELGEELLLPCNMLRMGENVFLDDMTVEELEERLNVPVRIVEEEGEALLLAALGETAGGNHKRRQNYEQTDCSHSGPAECGEIHPL